MAAAAFLGCIDTGHGCWWPRIGVTASHNVFVNGIPAHREYDLWAPHCCPKKGCHPGIVKSGAGNVSINGRGAARMGDSISCGGMIAMGSPNVDFGAPLGAMDIIGGALDLAEGFGIEIPTFSEALGKIGIDVTGIDVTAWVSENILNGAVLPPELLKITESLTNQIKDGSIMEVLGSAADLASVTNLITPGGGISGTINLGALNTVANALNLGTNDLLDRLQAQGIVPNSGKLADALKVAMDTNSKGMNLDQLKEIGRIMGVKLDDLKLPDIDKIIKDKMETAGLGTPTDETLEKISTEAAKEKPGSNSIAGIIVKYTGLDAKSANNAAAQLSGMTVPYVQKKVQAYLQENLPGVVAKQGTKAVDKIVNTLKTKITMDIKEETGGVIFL